MTFGERIRRRYALSHQGYRDLKAATACCVAFNLAQMSAIMILFIFLCDIMGDYGGESNPYDFDLEEWAYIALILASLVLMGIAYYFQYNATYFRTYRMSGQKRTDLAEKIRKLPMSYYSKKDPTDLTIRMLGDVYFLEQAMSHWFPQLIASFIFAGIIGTMVLLWSPLVGTAMLWPIPIALSISLSSRRLQDRTNKKAFAANLDASESVQECLEAMRDLRASNAQGAYRQKLNGKFKLWVNAQIRAELTMGGFVSAAQLALKFGVVTTAIVGGALLAKGNISVFVFVMAVLMCTRINAPIDVGLQNLGAMVVASNNMARMQEIEGVPVQGGSTDFKPEGYDIRFENVKFSYEEGNEVLNDVSFTAKQGEVTALIGPSGEGKTTAAKLSARFWDVQGGKVSVGGIDVSTVDPETLLSAFAIVFQDVTLFNASVEDNIRIGKKGATDEEIRAAAKAAQCDDFVSKMPRGYDTVIGENGSKLSGGERQRISIARAILKGAPIVLLDEATASLDAESESQVQAALSELLRGKTVIIVAHRMRTVEGADKIVVLKDGVVDEQGAPRDLLQRGGTFARMDRLQKSSQDWAI